MSTTLSIVILTTIAGGGFTEKLLDRLELKRPIPAAVTGNGGQTERREGMLEGEREDEEEGGELRAFHSHQKDGEETGRGGGRGRSLSDHISDGGEAHEQTYGPLSHEDHDRAYYNKEGHDHAYGDENEKYDNGYHSNTMHEDEDENEDDDEFDYQEHTSDYSFWKKIDESYFKPIFGGAREKRMEGGRRKEREPLLSSNSNSPKTPEFHHTKSNTDRFHGPYLKRRGGKLGDADENGKEGLLEYELKPTTSSNSSSNSKSSSNSNSNSNSSSSSSGSHTDVGKF